MAKALASRLGLKYLDTGAMYRAIALKASRAGLGPGDHEAAAKLAEKSEIAFGETLGAILLDGEDISALIRSPEISELASALSTFPDLRRTLVARQQAMLADGGFTLEGRDVTTVVAPNAQVKVYLTASLEERAERRRKELASKGQEAQFSDVRKQVETRDYRDITRDDSPLSVAPGATIIESGGLTVDQVIERILDLIPASL